MRKTKHLSVVLALLIVVAIAAMLMIYSGQNSETNVSNDSSLPSASSVPVQSVNSAVTEESHYQGDISLPEVQDTVVSIVACGDNLIHPSVYYYAMECYAKSHDQTCTYAATNEANYDFFPIYTEVAAAMKEADICYINQETLSGGDGSTIGGWPKFNCPEAVGRTIKELGADVVNLAHNHMLDSYDDSYLKHTDAFLSSIGMTTIGYYENEADTNNIVLLEQKGITFAFLAYTYSTNGITCNSQTYIPYFNESLIRKQVALAKQQADVVLVSAHWGDEDSYTPNSSQRRYAQLFCELGVDVVIGMHPHCLQPIEWMTAENGNRTLIAYSLGNFVSGQQWANEILEGMLSFNIRKDGETGKITVEDALLTPLVMHSTHTTAVAKNDTGYRNFKVYRLSDYTEELAAKNSAHWYEDTQNATKYLYGTGEFSIANLAITAQKLIPAEFLPQAFKDRFAA